MLHQVVAAVKSFGSRIFNENCSRNRFTKVKVGEKSKQFTLKSYLDSLIGLVVIEGALYRHYVQRLATLRLFTAFQTVFIS